MSEKLGIGLIVGLTEDPDEEFAKVADLGLDNCQLSCWTPQILNQGLADKINAASQTHGVRVSSYWAGYSGDNIWNFLEGPATIGLVPLPTRDRRADELKQGADFAALIDTPSITTHVGFIPEDPKDPKYTSLVPVLRDVAQHCKDKGLRFCFETGQETPLVILRAIEDIGLDNLGINLDPANLVLYGKANPVDSLDVFGQYVEGLHAKDGLYPTNGRDLGKEVPLGEGKVDFPVLLARLKEYGFKGPITIEREISGEQQVVDIRRGIDLLTPLV